MSNTKQSTQSKPGKKLVKVKFIASPAAQFFIANRPGQTGEFTEDQVKELVKAGVAERI